MTGLRFSRKQLCIPYAAFLVLFVVIPMFLILLFQGGRFHGTR